MYFCENCQKKKGWPDSAVVSNERCEVCKQPRECYDVPSVMLVPEADRTLEQKLILKTVQDGFREKAEALVITGLDGRIDHLMTARLQQVFAKRGCCDVDWYASYNLRLKAQEGYQRAERTKRDRRN